MRNFTFVPASSKQRRTVFSWLIQWVNSDDLTSQLAVTSQERIHLRYPMKACTICLCLCQLLADFPSMLSDISLRSSFSIAILDNSIGWTPGPVRVGNLQSLCQWFRLFHPGWSWGLKLNCPTCWKGKPGIKPSKTHCIHHCSTSNWPPFYYLRKIT